MKDNMQNTIYKFPFTCPICRSEFGASDNKIICPNGHSFDRSRQGYYNLLISNKSSSHGDNREMVLARRAFLGSGFYKPLSDLVSSLVLSSTERGGLVLDAGCGEGYYTDSVERSLRERDGLSFVAAFDISKEAASRCSRLNPNIFTAVAGSYKMPLADSSVTTLINVFAPMAIDEVKRVLKSGAHFIIAVPDADHLFELKSLLYDEPYKNKLSDSHIEGFELTHDERLTYPMELDSPELIDSLFMMTPYAYRTSPERRERIRSRSSLTVTADFHVYVYRKV